MKNLFGKVLIAGLTVASSVQLFAAATNTENIKTDIVYTVSDSADTTTSEADLTKLYNEKCFEILSTDFNISRDKLLKDAHFSVFVMNKESLDKDEAHWLELCEKEFAEKKITEADYKKQKEQLKKEYNNYRNRVANAHHDIAECQYHFDYETPNGAYRLRFNANTKEAEMVMVPLSKEGWALQTAVVNGKKAAPVSKASDQTKTTNATNFINSNHIGNIENPKLVKIAGPTHNRFYFQDTNDTSKKVLIFVDPVKFTVFSYDLGKAASQLS